MEATRKAGPKISKARLILVSVMCLGISGATIYLRQMSIPDAAPTTTTVVKAEIKTVTALGRLAPKGETIKLAAPTAIQEQRLKELLVKEGDVVKQGQVIAVLEGQEVLESAWREAEAQVEVAQAQLALVEAGAKRGQIEEQRAEIARIEANYQGEIAVQKATIAQLTAEVQNAQTEFERYERLYQDGAVAASERDKQALRLQTAKTSLEGARAQLERLYQTNPEELSKAQAALESVEEVRSQEVEVAAAEVKKAEAAAAKAKADLEQLEVRSPQDGVVLYIHSRAGEVISEEGIVEIGETQQMYVVAEVYETDVKRVKPGQKAIISSDALPQDLEGTVERVGQQVRRQNAINTDPSENIDGRIVEVQIALNEASSQIAAPYSNLQVKVVIDL